MTRPIITIDPAINFGAPSIRGIPTATIASMIAAGDTVTAVADDYNLSRHDVLLACWFEADHSQPTWRAWAERVGPRLAGMVPWHPDVYVGPAV